jgi:hypothetical protein
MDNFIIFKSEFKNDKSNILLENLIKKQIKDIEIEKKFSLSDIKRLNKHIKDDIFGDKCVIWEGAFVNSNKKDYINFFLNGKKFSLNRLLYINYKDKLKSNEYLKYSCNNNLCCTINHIKKC